ITTAIIALLALIPSVQAQNQKLRVNDAAVADRLLAQGGKLVADYGSFKIIEAEAASVAGETNQVESVAESNFIELHAGPLDTRTTAAKALRRARGSFRGQNLHLIQFAAPVKPEWRQALEQTGVRIVTYIPQNAYLIYGDAAALALAQAWAGTNPVVQWEGDYQNDWKINPDARITNALGQAHWPGTDFFAIQLVEDPSANSNTLAQVNALKLAPVERESRALGYRNIFVQLPPEKLAELATNADVVSIQPYFPRKKFCERQAQIMAGNLTGNVPSGPGYLAWLTGKGFTQAQFDASGFVVDVTDSGVDNGTTSPNHFGLHLGGTNSLSSRVAYARLEGTANTGSTLQGCDGHGNLNAHIIAGYDNLSGTPFADASGYHYGLGICPFVKVGSSVIFDSSTFTSPSYNNLASRAYRDGARVSNNSWGADTAGAYDADAQNYDALVRDAQPSGAAVATAGNQEMVFVFAAGNAGSSAKTVGSPGTGKNIICVGAAENVQAFGGADGSGITDTGADSANDVISFSSR
ncbi:MAG: S8 family serine peptidase, partial [Verrucomicrobiota bacterium]